MITWNPLSGTYENLSADSDPDETVDASQGFRPGAQWITATDCHVCIDASIGAAKWLSQVNGTINGAAVAPVLDTTNLLIDINPEEGVTVTSGRVTTLVEQAASVSFTPITSGPRFIPSVASLNGRAALLYEPASGIQALSAAGITNASTSHTIYAYADALSATPAVQELIDCVTGRVIFYSRTGGNVGHFDGASRAYAAAAEGAQRLTLRLDSSVSPGGQAWRGTTSLGTNNYTSRSWGGTTAIGIDANSPSAARMFHGYIARILVFSEAHDADQRADVWEFLDYYYSTEVV